MTPRIPGKSGNRCQRLQQRLNRSRQSHRYQLRLHRTYTNPNNGTYTIRRSNALTAADRATGTNSDYIANPNNGTYTIRRSNAYSRTNSD